MPVSPGDMNDIRVDVLGTSVDQATTWTTTGPTGNRNELATTITERVITRLLNDMVGDILGSVGATNGFADRFNTVIGDEGGADQAAFNSLGTNLIQALAAGGVHEAQHASALVWNITHGLGKQWVDVTVISPGQTNPTAPQTIIVPRIDYVSTTACSLHFHEPVAGTAIVRR